MLHLLLNKQLVTLDSIIIPCVRVCVCVPHLGAVEHPDLVQSLLGCHGASERLPQAVESTEVTSLSASCSPPPTSDAQHHDSPARCNTPSDAIQRWMADVPRQKRKKKLSRELFHGGGQTVQFPGRTRRSRACVLPLNRLFQRVFPSSVCTVNENNTQAISVYRSRRRQTRRQPRPNTGSTAAPCALCAAPRTPRGDGLRFKTARGKKGKTTHAVNNVPFFRVLAGKRKAAEPETAEQRPPLSSPNSNFNGFSRPYLTKLELAQS